MDKELTVFLTTQFGALNDSIVRLTKDFHVMKQDMHSMKEDISTLKQDVGTLKQDVGTLQKDVGTLKQDVGILQKDVGTLKQDVTDIRRRQESTEHHVTQMIGMLGDVKSSVLNIEGKLELTNRRVDRHTHQIAELEEKIAINL